MTRRMRGASPHPIDTHLGLRVRARRKAVGLSLEALACALGIAYQQVQKYETGVNRISASTLYEIAKTLQTPVGYFYGGLCDAGAETGVSPSFTAQADALFATPGGGELARAYLAMPPRLRRALIALAQGIGEDDAALTGRRLAG